jgi:flagellar protein FliO/FliZ
MRHYCGFLATLATPLLAAPVSGAGATAGNANIIQWLVSCFLVIGLILLLAWLLKKSRLMPNQAQSQLRVLSVLSLGTREKLLVVKVGSEQLVLGMTPANISLLCKLETPLDEQSLVPPFAAQLAKLMKPGTTSAVEATADSQTGGHHER